MAPATATAAAPRTSTRPQQPWTCPFCTLLCDGFSVASADATPGAALRLVGSDCVIANAALARFGAAETAADAHIDGRAVSTEAAIDRAAQILAASRQPLIGGLGLDVDGARALYPLACATGAITDGGASMLHGLRALQDRGQFTTTFAEVRNRAQLIVCFGPSPRESHPEIWRRLGIGEALVTSRDVVFVGAETDAVLDAQPHTQASSVALDGDLFDTVSRLAACVAGQRVQASEAIVALAEKLRASPYSVVIWDSTQLPAQGSLIVEALNAMVGVLNRSTRAAALPLGSAVGASAVNQTFSWLSGLPLPSRAGPLGLEHEPLRFDSKRLLAEGGADALLWIASFGNEYEVPATNLPTIVIGHAQMQAPPNAVFIPVATPGLDDAGHLYRVDGSVMLPVDAVRVPTLPRAVDVLKQLTTRVQALKSSKP
jgi:formylmethanofuran dehydrogenase subunit B